MQFDRVASGHRFSDADDVARKIIGFSRCWSRHSG
jgi:hypothetical protein